MVDGLYQHVALAFSIASKTKNKYIFRAIQVQYKNQKALR